MLKIYDGYNVSFTRDNVDVFVKMAMAVSIAYVPKSKSGTKALKMTPPPKKKTPEMLDVGLLTPNARETAFL